MAIISNLVAEVWFWIIARRYSMQYTLGSNKKWASCGQKHALWDCDDCNLLTTKFILTSHWMFVWICHKWFLFFLYRWCYLMNSCFYTWIKTEKWNAPSDGEINSLAFLGSSKTTPGEWVQTTTTKTPKQTVVAHVSMYTYVCHKRGGGWGRGGSFQEQPPEDKHQTRRRADTLHRFWC